MTQVPRAEKGLTCPLHKKDVSLVCHRCPWWMKLRGRHPQTNQEIDQWGCAIGLLPVLLIENAKQERAVAAAVEDLRDRSVEAQEVTNLILAQLGGDLNRPVIAQAERFLLDAPDGKSELATKCRPQL